jgi:hypothetical protein
MHSKYIARLATAGVLLAALVVAAPASAGTLRGVVVHRNHHAGSFVVALSGGKLAAVHAKHSPRVGRTVRVNATRLRNGTFSARSIRVGARSRHALLRGVVTYVNRRRGLYTVSSRGASILIHHRSHRSHRVRAVGDTTLPVVGENVTVETGIDDQGDLNDESIQDNGPQTENMDIHGTILAVDPTARTLSVSSDDDDHVAGLSPLTIHVPDTIDISTFKVGSQVELRATLQPDGSFLLVGAASDDNEQEANNPSDEQGKQGSGGSDSGSCGGGHDSRDGGC